MDLKEEILQAVNDARDLTDNIVSVPILSHFLDNILKKQLTLTDVVKQSEQLCDNPHCEDGVVDNIYGHPIYCQVCNKCN